jgi:4-amino-4-deoxy-L-arabinose transferase-like glycosyltransferase
VSGQVRWLGGLAAVAIGARLVAAYVLGPTFHFSDETAYVDAAHRLLAGDGFADNYRNVPAYPVALALLAAPWPQHLTALRCAQAALAGAGCLLLLAFGTRVFGARPARAAAAFYALDPLLVVAAGLLYPEAVAALALLATLTLAVLAARRDRLALALATGLALAFLIQLRWVALVLLPVIALWIAATVAAPPARRALHALVLAAACVLALAPWAVHNHRVHGQLVPAGTPGLRGAPVARDAIQQRGIAASMALRLWHDPLGFAGRVGSEFGHFWELYPTRLQSDNPQRRAALHQRDPRLPIDAGHPPRLRDVVSALTFGSQLALALAGLVVAWRRRRAETVLLVAVTLAYGLGYALFIAKLRYRITVLPAVLLLAGVGAVALADALAARVRARRAPA